MGAQASVIAERDRATGPRDRTPDQPALAAEPSLATA
jgi:hypothetical protein